MAVKTTGKLLAVPGSTVRPTSAVTSKYAPPAPSLVAAVMMSVSLPALVTVKMLVMIVPGTVGGNAGPVIAMAEAV